ncbi:MAG: rRNA cytosine-C5-methyltransferase [Nocardioides sp.]|nr:rRNA cytosine-C5-methyltransferase [Nocardioides sp.]
MTERRMTRADPARLAAYDVLKAVRVDDAYTNLVLPHVLREHGLSGRDAAFVTELVSGTLRGQGTYDAVIDACLTKPKLEAKVRDALRLGVHQLLGMRVPDHAAISSSVDLVRARVGQGPAGLTNAVLRKVSQHDLDGWVRRVAPDPGADPVGYASVAYSHPRWVVEELTRAVGTDELDALLTADNDAPRVVLAARPGRVDRTELPGEPTTFSPYGVVLASGDPGAVPAVADGRAGVQDEGSQLVSIALARAAVNGGAGETWLDLCAGPGGKAALLAGLAAAQGAGLVAAERQHHRSLLVRRNLAGADGVLGILTADGTAPPWAPGTFDRVLVDAPCSGLGALRRRPEARWRRTPGDVSDLVPLQEALLESAIESVRPGGVVLYATCSPVLAETRGVVETALSRRPDARLDDARALLGDVPDCDGPLPGTVQLWPHRHHTDAMFMALVRRDL